MPRERTPERRAKDRAYARKSREMALDAKNATSRVCKKGLGAHAICGGILLHGTDGFGHTVTSCPMCDRRRAGVCRECPLPVAGRVGYAIRCATHLKAAQDRYFARYKDANRDKLARKARLRARKLDKQQRAKRNARRKLWRQANPNAVKAHKRRDHHSEQRREYMREWHRRKREERLTRQKELATGTASLRVCVTPGCDIVVTGKKKKCTKCRQRTCETARAKLAELQRQERAA